MQCIFCGKNDPLHSLSELKIQANVMFKLLYHEVAVRPTNIIGCSIFLSSSACITGISSLSRHNHKMINYHHEQYRKAHLKKISITSPSLKGPENLKDQQRQETIVM